jgi:hypothetical protein
LTLIPVPTSGIKNQLIPFITTKTVTSNAFITTKIVTSSPLRLNLLTSLLPPAA